MGGLNLLCCWNGGNGLGWLIYGAGDEVEFWAGLVLVLSLRLLLLKFVTVDRPIQLLIGGLGVQSVLTPCRFPSSATVNNIFISNCQQLFKNVGF